MRDRIHVMAYQRLWDVTHRDPFHPFRVTMSDGKVIEVMARFRCAVMPQYFVVEKEGQTQFHPIGDVRDVEELQPA